MSTAESIPVKRRKEKPAPMPVLAENLPQSLRASLTWVCWSWKWKPTKHGGEGGWDKPPKQPDKSPASSNNPDTWCSFQEAFDAHCNGDFDGVGICLDDDDGLVGIDLDDCRCHETGVIDLQAQGIINKLASYSEVSPSGTGVRIVVRASLSDGSKVDHDAGIEIYAGRGRYLTLTGHRIDGTPATIEERSEELEGVIADNFSPPTPRELPAPQQLSNFSPTTLEQIASALAACPQHLCDETESWSGIGHAIHRFDSSAAALAIWDSWSGRSPNYMPGECERRWRRMGSSRSGSGGEMTINTIFKHARDAGWRPKRQDAFAAKNKNDLPQAENLLPEVILPGNVQPIIDAARQLGQLLDKTGQFFCRGGVPFRASIDDKGDLSLKPLRPAAACSDFESVAVLKRAKETKDGIAYDRATCSESTAKLIIESMAFLDSLPPINVLSPAPVLIERNGELVQVCGYDRESGIYAMGSPAPDIPLREAITIICDSMLEFRFATDGDRSRAIAAMITPALVFGGLLDARAPIDFGEADNSQAGKGYRNKLTTAIYATAQQIVTQRNGGVGSTQETFDRAVVSGAQFICFDNCRGKLDLPGVESFVTEDRYLARVPYAGSVEIDPRKTVIAVTSNKAETTIDFANRSSIVRIMKQPADHVFTSYAEGDLLDHVRANQSRYLGAVFSVIREWHRLGKPTVVAVGHDFRRWAGVLGYIVENIMGAGQLLIGHRAVQERSASPSQTWLREVALAVISTGHEGQWLRPSKLLNIVVDRGIETPGLRDDADYSDEATFVSATRALGKKLATPFAGDSLTIDNIVIDRQQAYDQNYRTRPEYKFTQTA